MPDYLSSYLNRNICVHQKPEAVEGYTHCRFISEGVLERFSNEILETIKEKVSATIMEAGVGNGRLFLPILKKAKGNANFFGVDVSEPMLNDLSKKISEDQKVKIYCADLRDETFFKRYFPGNVNTIYTFATMHIISQGWQKALDNLINSLSSNGTLVLGEEVNSVFHGSETLFEKDDYRLTKLKEFFKGQIDISDLERVERFFKEYPRLRIQYESPFERFNSQILHGDQGPAERYIRSTGFCEKTIELNELKWIKPHSFGEIISCIEKGIVTTLGSDLPEKIRLSFANDLKNFCVNHNYNLEEKLMIPSEIQLHCFKRDD